MQLNRNNFLIWDGAFNNLPVVNIATNEAVSASLSETFVQISPLANDISTFGINANTLVITSQPNALKPATWNPATKKITYYTSELLGVGAFILNYKWKDLQGNESNEGLITITQTARATSWRPALETYTCVLSGGVNTGYSTYLTLRKYWDDVNTPVVPEETKPNTVGEPDYIAPVLDGNCNPQPYTTVSLGFTGIEANKCDTLALNNYYVANAHAGLPIGARIFTNTGLTSVAPNGYYSANDGLVYTTHNGYIIDQTLC